ncbi:Neudesin [Dactylella cylindrospora]|nr:Neudesin [Dactylella cylindrospora]
MTSENPNPPVAEVTPLLTPVNLILFSLALYLIYMRLKPTPLPALPDAPQPIVYTTFTPTTLLKHNGKDDPRILMAVKGVVFDVTSGSAFYGPGGPYSIFAGRDASRGLAKGALEEGLLTPVGEKIDTLGDLSGDEREALQGWFDQFSGKYLVVGELRNEGEGGGVKSVDVGAGGGAGSEL